jgi:hypothetical protein
MRSRQAARSIACSVTKRGVGVRTLAVLGIGVAVLVAILYYASTVDGRPPTVQRITLTQHLSGDSHVALITSSIAVDFSEPVQHASAEAAFAISPQVSGQFSWSSASLTFTPDRLSLRTTFEVTIGPGVRDRVGNEMATGAPPFRFTTVGNPSVVASAPADAGADVALDAPIVVDFSTLMDTASVERALHFAPSSDLRLRWARERLTIVPVAPLDPNRRYTLTIGVGARDQAGTPLDRPFKLSFRTVPSRLAPETMVPADGVSGIAVTTSIAVVFDRALDPASVRDDLLTITPTVAGSLDAIASPGAAGLLNGKLRVLRFQPSGPLDPNTTYDVTLAPGLLGADGAGLPAGLSWSFTTGAPTATLSNQVVFLSDRAGIANLWAMNPDGTNERQLSVELSPVIDYAVAPDGRAFVVGDGAAIVWQHADGSARRLLTDANSVEFDPAYSPDGSLLSFGRADPVLGTGLGLWTRQADGSDPRPVELPAEGIASPSPAIPVPAPLLRAPRLSPDGTALAFVDEAGRVAILDLEQHRLSEATFVALSEPVWLPDSSGVLVSGLSAGSGLGPRAYRPRSAVPLLDPLSFAPDATQLAAMRVVRLDRGAASISPTAVGDGAARPALDADGRLAYISLQGGDAAAGSLWVTNSPGDPGDRVMRDPGARVGFASFAPEPQAMVISRLPASGSIATGSDGIWLVNLRSGEAEQLAVDGWLPRWLP